jgi:hypothetical protein
MKLDTSFAQVYEPQHALFGRLVRMCFTFAGCYWIVIYLLQWLLLIDQDQLRDFRSGQTLIYFILLSLWGVEYLRETRRLKQLIRRSEELDVRVSRISLSDLHPRTGSFAILRPVGVLSAKQWIFPVLNITGLALAVYLIVQRYAAAIIAVL